MTAPDYEARRAYLGTFPSVKAGRDASARLSRLITLNGQVRSKVDVAEELIAEGGVISSERRRVTMLDRTFYGFASLSAPVVQYMQFLASFRS